MRRAAACVGLLLAAGVHAADAPDMTLAETGRKTYTSFCARCHGMNLVTTGNSFDLRTFPRDDKERFVRSVSKGKNTMPAWESTLTAADIDALWAYVMVVQGVR
jgi:mono/diheme cytochrome c family protein